jgi:cation transport regulator ChaB
MPKGQWTPPDAGDAPAELKRILAEVYSSCRDEHPEENEATKARCAQTAWAAVEKAGYHKNKDGKWIKSEMTYGVEFGELCAEEIKITPVIDVAKLTEGDPNPFFVTVKALKTGISKNRFNYSVENLMQLKAQLPLYGYLGHLKEQDASTLYRDWVTIWIGAEILDDWLYVKGYIPPQEDWLRKKVALSLKAKPMTVSIQGLYQLKSRGEYNDVISINALGLDWATSGMEGIEGAQVIKVGKETTEKEEIMPTKEEILAALTLDEIKKEKPEIVKTIQSEMQNSEEEKKRKETEQKSRDDDKKKIETLEKENLDLKKKSLDGHRTKLLAEIADEKVRELAGELLKGESVEELDKNWVTVKEKFSKLQKTGMPIIAGAETKSNKAGADFIEDRLLA